MTTVSNPGAMVASSPASKPLPGWRILYYIVAFTTGLLFIIPLVTGVLWIGYRKDAVLSRIHRLAFILSLVSTVLTYSLLFGIVWAGGHALNAANNTGSTSVTQTDNQTSSAPDLKSIESDAIQTAQTIDADKILPISITDGSEANSGGRAGNYAEDSAVTDRAKKDVGIASSILFTLSSDRRHAFCNSQHLTDPGFLAYVYDRASHPGFSQDLRTIDEENTSHALLCAETYDFNNVGVVYSSAKVMVIEYNSIVDGAPRGRQLMIAVKRADGIWYDHQDVSLA